MQRLPGYDAWKTREPDWPEEEPEERHCSRCGAFLVQDPDRSESWEDFFMCDGKPSVVVDTYTERDAGVLNIIGWEHLGERFEVTYPPSCGDDEPHELHKVVTMDGVFDIRVCRACGHENVEVYV